MKVKRAGLLTKLLIAIFVVAILITNLDLQSQIRGMTETKATLERLNAKRRQENEVLAVAIQQKDDPERIKKVARERLGYMAPGEIAFYDSGN